VRWGGTPQKQFGVTLSLPSVVGRRGVIEVLEPERCRTKSGEALRNSAQTLKKALVCDEEPPLGSILYLHTVPPVGGDTLFANQYAAYEALSPRMKTYLEGLTATHSGEHVYRATNVLVGRDDRGQVFPQASHVFGRLVRYLLLSRR
jgi:taurine dioxygenase